MNKSEIQRLVRQRERFACPYPSCEKMGEQYAHINAVEIDGNYTLDNLLYLCSDHHNYWQESSRTTKEVREALYQMSIRLRDLPKQDTILNRLFDFPSGQKQIINIGGGFKFINTNHILRCERKPENPYLSIGTNEYGIFRINAHFDNEKGETFMTIRENKFIANSSDLWDIVIRRRHISIVNSSRKIKLSIRQKRNLELEIVGTMYLNDEFFNITKKSITSSSINLINNSMQNCNSGGILLGKNKMII